VAPGAVCYLCLHLLNFDIVALSVVESVMQQKAIASAADGIVVSDACWSSADMLARYLSRFERFF